MGSDSKMIEEIYKLYQLIKQMNNAGYEALCEMAVQILSHERYKKENIAEIKVSQLDSDIDQVLAIANSHHA